MPTEGHEQMVESDGLNEEIRQQAEKFRLMLDDARQLGVRLEPARRREARTDQALALLYCRALKFFDAYLCLIEARLGEPAAALVRSLYETSLLMRWVLRGEPQAIGFLLSGQDEARRHLRYVAGHLSAAGMKPPELPEQTVWSDEERRSPRPPGWEKLSGVVGLRDLHDLLYGMLSASAHGNLLGFGEEFIRGLVSGGPSPYNIAPLFPAANNVFLDCQRVYLTWIDERRIYDPPDVKALMKVEDDAG